jgi:hypothetical protein
MQRPLIVLATAVTLATVPASSAPRPSEAPDKVLGVSGTGVHYFTTAIVHSTEPTPTGMIQRSTETVDLTGDLTGRLLYHPTSVFDFVQGTLVNTGSQVFSGTVLGSAPVMLYDDAFRFEVNLNTGATTGEVHLTHSLAGPKMRCHLTVSGTGMTPEGNATFAYTGECRFRGQPADASS